MSKIDISTQRCHIQTSYKQSCIVCFVAWPLLKFDILELFEITFCWVLSFQTWDVVSVICVMMNAVVWQVSVEFSLFVSWKWSGWWASRWSVEKSRQDASEVIVRWRCSTQPVSVVSITSVRLRTTGPQQGLRSTWSRLRSTVCSGGWKRVEASSVCSTSQSTQWWDAQLHSTTTSVTSYSETSWVQSLPSPGHTQVIFCRYATWWC